MVRKGAVAIGYLCLIAGGVLLLRSASIQAEADSWQERHADPGAWSEPAENQQTESISPRRAGDAVTRLSIQGVGLEVVVAEGTDPATLAVAPGHLTGSASPGESGNCIIAGHRDGEFARLRNVRTGDRITLKGREENNYYRVESVSVVDRTDHTPLAPTDKPVLTLITCYPFNHIGPAPERLIVRGRLIE